MSTKLAELQSDIKEAMKAREQEKLTCLRSFHSEVKNVSIDNKEPITDAMILQVAQKYVKQRKDASEQFAKGGRQDLVDAEGRQMEWVGKYLPRQMDDAELEALVTETVQGLGATNKKDMGRVMKELMPKVQGRADGKRLSAEVGKHLS